MSTQSPVWFGALGKCFKRHSFIHCQNYKQISINLLLAICVLVFVKSRFTYEDENTVIPSSEAHRLRRENASQGVITVKVNENSEPENLKFNDVAAGASEFASLKPKTILLWTPYYTNRSMFQTGGQELLKKIGCRVTNCAITSDRSSFDGSDAVVFHAFDLYQHEMPSHRWPHQRFVFYLLETIPMFRGHALFFTNITNNYFNWTMTHRRDSDIYHIEPHGVLRRKKTSEFLESLPPRLYPGVQLPSSATLMDTQRVQRSKRWANKTKLAAWFSSNCDSPGKREAYINRLKQYINLDVYGKCGDKECLPRNGAQCNNLLDSYKFYLSFENSLCPDYISEKFYRALERDIVPVVYGGGDYEAYAPPHSFIHVADFDSPKSLADYLLFLDKNDAMYSKYFEWKKDYKVEMSPPDGWCELCEKLHDKSLPVKWYPSLDKWWYDDAPCYPGDSFIGSLPKDN